MKLFALFVIWILASGAVGAPKGQQISTIGEDEIGLLLNPHGKPGRILEPGTWQLGKQDMVVLKVSEDTVHAEGIVLMSDDRIADVSATLV
ncbi:MAG: hypothetical protein WC489_09345 [Patescibacteria group bacterium]